MSRALGHGVVVPGVDPPSSILGGEAFLARIYDAYRAMRSPAGANIWNTALLIGWDEPGGTYDHVPPGPVPPPDPTAPAGQAGFRFDRSGYRVPAILVSPWIAEGAVFNDEYRHSSLIATLREQWKLGDPLTGRDAAARTFSDAFTLDTPRNPDTWPVADPRPVPRYVQDALGLGQSLSTLGKAAFDGIRQYAQQHNLAIDGLPADPAADTWALPVAGQASGLVPLPWQAGDRGRQYSSEVQQIPLTATGSDTRQQPPLAGTPANGRCGSHDAGSRHGTHRSAADARRRGEVRS